MRERVLTAGASTFLILLGCLGVAHAEEDMPLDLGGGEPKIVEGSPSGRRLELRHIPAGKLVEGSPPNEVGHEADETPRNVTLSKGFWLGKTPVTRAQFARFVTETRHVTDAEKGQAGGFGWDSKTTSLLQRKEYTWKNPGFPQKDDDPVVLVTFGDANAFTAWASRKTGRRVRLPTEAEWEYAARAGTTTPWYGGSKEEDAYALGWFRPNASFSTHPVGQKKPNAWGLFDMSGNVQQWVKDVYAPYPAGDATDPENTTNTSTDPERRVVRGGSWLRDPKRGRSAARGKHAPGARLADIGFRVAVDEDETAPPGMGSIPSDFAPAAPLGIGSSNVTGQAPLVGGDASADVVDVAPRPSRSSEGLPWSMIAAPFLGAGVVVAWVVARRGSRAKAERDLMSLPPGALIASDPDAPLFAPPGLGLPGMRPEPAVLEAFVTPPAPHVTPPPIGAGDDPSSEGKMAVSEPLLLARRSRPDVEPPVVRDVVRPWDATEPPAPPIEHPPVYAGETPAVTEPPLPRNALVDQRESESPFLAAAAPLSERKLEATRAPATDSGQVRAAELQAFDAWMAAAKAEAAKASEARLAATKAAVGLLSESKSTTSPMDPVSRASSSKPLGELFSDGPREPIEPEAIATSAAGLPAITADSKPIEVASAEGEPRTDAVVTEPKGLDAPIPPAPVPTVDPQTAAPRPSEAVAAPKPSEPRPPEAKASEPRPSEAKASEAKLTAATVAGAGPAEPRPAVPRPAEAKPSVPRPADVKPSEPKPSVSAPAASSEPSEASPASPAAPSNAPVPPPSADSTIKLDVEPSDPNEP